MKGFRLPFGNALTTAVVICFALGAGQSSRTTKLGSAASRLVVAQHVENLDQLAREPSIVEHPDGTLFVSGYGRPVEGSSQRVPRLWKSADHGATWTRVNVGTEADGAVANSDVSLAVAGDGTLYFATMEFDRNAGEGVHIEVGISKDMGATWHWSMLSEKRFDDRPWVAVAPDGTAHVIWNDGSGVYHSSTRDRGATWSAPQTIHAAGGSSDLAVGPSGQVAVRIVPTSAGGVRFTEGTDLIAVSADGGATWQKRSAPGERDWAPAGTPGTVPRWVEPLTWDSTGALYSLWTNIRGIWLARSLDSGVTWKTWRVAQIDEVSYFPYLTARGQGQLAATWFSGAGERLQWHVARIYAQGSEVQPRIVEAPALEAECWNAADAQGNAPVRDTGGEYLSALFLRDGDLAVVSPIQNPAAKRFGFEFWRFDAR